LASAPTEAAKVALSSDSAYYNSQFRTPTNLFICDNGKTYNGTFYFKLWPPSFAAVGVGNPLAEVTGTTLGTRITVD
jgi:hypothetical protein